MISYTHNIAETRDILHKISNELVDSYLQNLQEKAEKDVQENQNIVMLTQQNKLQFQEIEEKDKEITDYKKKCYDYEQIINQYQEEMVEIEEKHKCEGKLSIIKVQADELTKKDQYIEQLENKIKFLQTEKKNVSFKIEDDIIEENTGELSGGLSGELSGGWSPTSNKTPSLQEKEIVKEEEENKMDIDEEVKEKVEVNEDDEDDNDEDEIEYKRIKYKGKRYYIVVGEEPQIVYEILEDEDVGLRVGIRKKKTKGTGYSIDFD